jgi:hypothetical protein
MTHNITTDSNETSVPDVSLTSNNGTINDKSAVRAGNQTSKRWFILAMVVGAVVVIGVGGFGSVGLLQSHGIISLPSSLQWLASAIGTVGHTPHFWSLWALTTGGTALGVASIAYGFYKIHKAKVQERERLKAEKMRQEQLELETKTLKDNGIGQNFEAIGYKPSRFVGKLAVENNKGGIMKNTSKKSKDAYFVVVRTSQGELLCSVLTSRTTACKILKALADQLGYEKMTKIN